MLQVGAPIPAVTVLDDAGESFDSATLQGRRTVLFFYPKDNTPGCTSVASQFRDLAEQFAAREVTLIGVSRDSVASHVKFKTKYSLPFRLLADTDSLLCDAFGVIVEKNNYGKKSLGVQRSTFLIGTSGTIEKVWPKVTVDGHADAVLAAL